MKHFVDLSPSHAGGTAYNGQYWPMNKMKKKDHSKAIILLDFMFLIYEIRFHFLILILLIIFSEEIFIIKRKTKKS